MEDAGFFDEVEHLFRFCGRPSEGFGAEDGFAGVCCEPNAFHVKLVGKADDHGVCFGILDGFFQEPWQENPLADLT